MLIKKLNKIRENIAPKDSFKANALTMVAGSGFAQIIPLLIAPVLTRLYNPPDFGIFAIYMAIISVVAVIATGKYEYAITLPNSDKKAINIFFLVIIITSLISLTCFVILFYFTDFIFDSLNLSSLKRLFYLFPLGIFLTGIYQALNYWLIRKKMFGSMAIRKIIQFGAMAISQVIFGFMAFGAMGLILGFIIGQLFSYGFLLWQVWKNNYNDIISITVEGSLEQISRYKNFPIYSIPSTLCSTMNSESPGFLLNLFYNATITGFYDLPRRMLFAPALISDSVMAVFQERASSDLRTKGNCKEIYIKTFKTLALFAILPYLLLFLFSPKLIPFIFGQKWQIAGEYARYLSISGFTAFVASPLGFVLLIAEKQFVNFVFQFIYLLVNISALWLGANLHNPSLSVLYFALANSIMCSFYILLSYYFSVAKKSHEN